MDTQIVVTVEPRGDPSEVMVWITVREETVDLESEVLYELSFEVEPSMPLGAAVNEAVTSFERVKAETTSRIEEFTW